MRGALRDDASRSLVQPIEACIEARIAAGGVARQREVAVQPRVDALRLAVQAEEQQLRRRLGEMEQREEEEAHSRLVGGVDGREKRGLANGPLFANRRDDLHRVLQPRRSGAAQHVDPQLDDAPQKHEIPSRFVFGRREEQIVVGAKPVAKLGLLVAEHSETGEEQGAVERGDALVGLDGAAPR